MDLRAERLNRGLTLEEMAERVGVTRRVLQAAEGGQQPRPGNALKIADFLGCQVTDVWPIEPESTAGAAA
jgi:transcriptional regulator with XRE-family HTH domain